MAAAVSALRSSCTPSARSSTAQARLASSSTPIRISSSTGPECGAIATGHTSSCDSGRPAVWKSDQAPGPEAGGASRSQISPKLSRTVTPARVTRTPLEGVVDRIGRRRHREREPIVGVLEHDIEQQHRREVGAIGREPSDVDGAIFELPPARIRRAGIVESPGNDLSVRRGKCWPGDGDRRRIAVDREPVDVAAVVIACAQRGAAGFEGRACSRAPRTTIGRRR